MKGKGVKKKVIIDETAEKVGREGAETGWMW